MEYTGYVIDQRIPLTTPEDLNTFLSTGVRENFILDFKRDFPKNLEKTLAAFANTYGGTILIGVDETPAGSAVLPVHGLDFRPGLRERVLQMALDNIYPPLVPDVHVIPIKSSATIADADRAVIVVRVHESDDAPHAVEERTAVYLRVDNISDRFERKATIGEIEWLTNKREKSVAKRRACSGMSKCTRASTESGEGAATPARSHSKRARSSSIQCLDTLEAN
jgi:predicted HTH transcriptional regulator